MRLALKLPSVSNVYLRRGFPPFSSSVDIEASWFLPAIWPYVSVILRVCMSVCLGCTVVQQHTWTHAHTHNTNIEGDQEHQHVRWAPTDNVSATFPWHCSCVTSLPQCHSSSVRMLCLGWGWREVRGAGSAAGIGPLQMSWLIKGSSINVIEMHPLSSLSSPLHAPHWIKVDGAEGGPRDGKHPCFFWH